MIILSGMLRWLLASVVILVAAPIPAIGHPDGMWPDPPTLTPAQAARVDRLTAGAVAELARPPEGEETRRTGWLINHMIALGHCRTAEELFLAGPRSVYMSWIVIEAAGSADPQCVERFLALAAESPAWHVATSNDPGELYSAGALWRRLGRRRQGEGAIAAAERRLEQLDAGDEYAWACHGGYCLARLWRARLHGLRLYHGTELYSEELHRLASLAFADRRADELGNGRRRIGHRVFDELFWAAYNEGDTRLAEQLAPFTGLGRNALTRARIAGLVQERRIEEALSLWPVVGGPFGHGVDRDLVRADPEAFHRRRLRFLEWRNFSDAVDVLTLLPSVWLERGNLDRAAEALATAQTDIAAGGGLWRPEHRGRLAAVEAQLEGRANPVVWLAARDFNGDLRARDAGFAELAGGLAAAGRPELARGAIAAIDDARLRHVTLVELPCRAVAGGDAPARAAVDLAAAALAAPASAATESGLTTHPTFRCLVGAGSDEAALAYASAIGDPRLRLRQLTARPLASAADSDRLRRRRADRAFAVARTHGLWDDPAIASMAADFERLGEFGQVDAVLARARGDQTRLKIFEELLESYVSSGQ
ncbi:MAG TPA: hypothetical protein VF704_10845 [Allosphingosinicella sp.]|jgi:hypothetical protein